MNKDKQTIYPVSSAPSPVTGVRTEFVHEKTVRELEAEIEELAKTNESLRKELETDKLTGLNNLRGFGERIYEWFATKQQEDTQPLENDRRKYEKGAMIFIDLNGMKKMNDKLGYIATDNVIKEFSKLSKMVRKELDICCRYHGDEFVIYMPHADARLASQIIALKIKAILESSPIEVRDENGVIQQVDLSFAVGACQILDSPDDSTDRESVNLWIMKHLNESSILEKHAKKETANTIVVAYKTAEGEINIIPEDKLIERRDRIRKHADNAESK
ncbi:MAG: GGDEF domain-containing protein [Candidatus Berkelbacteria bacterium]